ncbi:MAG: 2-amino-4-hydroxy-6-hydroxymethyldihydropteridine diphosphokinase [Porphyromonadaceae bacterium]|nr:2-amino-4-hydroxy-6-hydroxymethyldihydropteridine diphosphokinase [Porphyromonadaceae bacterium]
MKHRIFLALGSNQGNRYELLERAISCLDKEVGQVLQTSSMIETEPWGFVSSSLFLNAVVELETELSPTALLDRTQDLEKELGRKEKSHNGTYQDRPIDIDILLYDDLVLQSDRLTLPHPLMHKRRFVLEPLSQIAPEQIHPVLQCTATELLAEVS